MKIIWKKIIIVNVLQRSRSDFLSANNSTELATLFEKNPNFMKIDYLSWVELSELKLIEKID